MSAYLVILGDRDAIRWVLTERRMAFPATPRAEVCALAPDDRLFLYATRGAWRNPTRDRGRIIATAKAKTGVRMLDKHGDLARDRAGPLIWAMRVIGCQPFGLIVFVQSLPMSCCGDG